MSWEKEYEHWRDYGHTWGPGLDGSEPTEEELYASAAHRKALEAKLERMRVEPRNEAIQAKKELEAVLDGLGESVAERPYNWRELYSVARLEKAVELAEGLGYQMGLSNLKDRDPEKFTISVEFHGYVEGKRGNLHDFLVMDVDGIDACLQLVSDLSALEYWPTVWYQDHHVCLSDSAELRLEMMRWGFPIYDDKNTGVGEEVDVSEARANVYLTLDENREWSAIVGTDIPCEGAVLFVKEEGYPVELYYSRTDLNGSTCVELDVCKNREELLCSLNWLGQCGYVPLKIWEFDLKKSNDKALFDVFNAGLERRQEAAREEWFELDDAALEALAEEPGEERYKPVEVVLNGNRQRFDTREEAIDYFMERVFTAKGDEYESCKNIYFKLVSGDDPVVYDNEDVYPSLDEIISDANQRADNPGVGGDAPVVPDRVRTQEREERD